MEISISTVVRTIITFCILTFIFLFVSPSMGLAGSEHLLFRVDPETHTKLEQLGDTPVSKLPVPIPFAVSLGDFTDTWGEPRSGGRVHKGTDMSAAIGELIISPTEAVVTKIGYDSLGGHFIITANPGDEQFYFAHLDAVAPELAVGDVLEAGDVIGYVGDTGNAKGMPHLHFEIYSEGISINPFHRFSIEFTLEEKTAILAGILKPSMVVKGADSSGIRFLQQFLITEASGPEAKELARHGATGYFGGVTERALAEYQAVAGIDPAVGYFGNITKGHILSTINPAVSISSQLASADAVYEVENESATDILFLSADLEIEAENDDVKVLQDFLVEQQAGPHAAALKENGTTRYFGPLTEDALIEYQEAVGILPAQGYFGSITRAVIRERLKG